MAALSMWTPRQWAYFVDDLLLRDHVFVRRQDLADEELVLRWGEMSGGKDTVIDAELLLGTPRGRVLRFCLSTLGCVSLEGEGCFQDIAVALNHWGLREDGRVVSAVESGAECVLRTLHCHLANVLVAMHIQQRFMFQACLTNALLIRETTLSRFDFRMDDRNISMSEIFSLFTSVMIKMCFVAPPRFEVTRSKALSLDGSRGPLEDKFKKTVGRFLTISAAFEADWLSAQKGGFLHFLGDFVNRGFNIVHTREVPPFPPCRGGGRVVRATQAGIVPTMKIIKCMEQLVVCTMTEGIFFCRNAMLETVKALKDVIENGLHAVPEETWLLLTASFSRTKKMKI